MQKFSINAYFLFLEVFDIRELTPEDLVYIVKNDYITNPYQLFFLRASSYFPEICLYLNKDINACEILLNNVYRKTRKPLTLRKFIYLLGLPGVNKSSIDALASIFENVRRFMWFITRLKPPQLIEQNLHVVNYQ